MFQEGLFARNCKIKVENHERKITQFVQLQIQAHLNKVQRRNLEWVEKRARRRKISRQSERAKLYVF